MDELRTAMDDGLIYPGTINWKDIQSWHARGQESCLRYMREKFTPITDVTEEIAGWACFDKDRGPAPRKVDSVKPDAFSGATPNASYRTGPKVGRNDPCPCGSGRKFKKCCGG